MLPLCFPSSFGLNYLLEAGSCYGNLPRSQFHLDIQQTGLELKILAVKMSASEPDQPLG